ncbi:hypothetical protein M9Y10_027258 [Tritrichomonas musculus]|uniref:Uncharacterized protein n=1 Tax=Tritrichomonas musculus TaxID=1915356 RepID=A0ABR2H5Y4_9EUKA
MADYSSMSVQDLISKIQNAERVIENQKKMLQAKDRLIQTTTDQYNELLADYQTLLSTSYQTAGSVPRRSPPALNAQFSKGNFDDQYRPSTATPRYNTFGDQPAETFSEPRNQQQFPAKNNSQFGVNNFMNNNENNNTQAENNVPYSKRALVSSIQFGEDVPVAPQRTSIQINQDRKAMNDHFQVEMDPGQATSLPPLVVDVSGMTVDQMRSKVDELNIERAEIERQLNKATPKGKIMSHVIKEREDLERQLEEVNKAISHVKLEIRKASNH